MRATLVWVLAPDMLVLTTALGTSNHDILSTRKWGLRRVMSPAPDQTSEWRASDRGLTADVKSPGPQFACPIALSRPHTALSRVRPYFKALWFGMRREKAGRALL